MQIFARGHALLFKDEAFVSLPLGQFALRHKWQRASLQLIERSMGGQSCCQCLLHLLQTGLQVLQVQGGRVKSFQVDLSQTPVQGFARSQGFDEGIAIGVALGRSPILALQRHCAAIARQAVKIGAVEGGKGF